MKKKKGAILTLALAGAITLGGAGALYAGMSKNMEEKQVAQVERKQEVSQETIQEEVAQEEVAQEETTQETGASQTWQEADSIYLPEGAEIVASGDYGYEITWDDCNISYKLFSKETQEDLGLGKLKPIIEDAITKYAGQDLGACNMEIFLEDPAANELGSENENVDVDLNIDMDAVESTIDENGNVTAVIISDDGNECIEYVCVEYADDTADSMPEEVREMYTLDSKCYQVHIRTDNQRYDIWVDSVTGLVTVFNYEDENLGTFTNGWDIEDSSEECKLSDAEQKEYDTIIEAFVTDELKLGNVEKFYSQDAYVNYIGNNQRAYYTVVCKTNDGAIVEITFDIGEKAVTSFRTSAQYLSK